MARQKKTTKQVKIPEIPLHWDVPDNVPTHRVTNILVQLAGDEFVVSFFEQRGPILITDEDREKAMKLRSAKALCVARICITPERINAFIKVLKQQYELHDQSKNKTT